MNGVLVRRTMAVVATRTGAVMVMATATCAGVSASTRPVIVVEAGGVI